MYTQWIENCVVQRVSVRDGLVLDLDDYNEIVISCPLLLTLPAVDPYPAEAVRIDPLKIATNERPLLNLAVAEAKQALMRFRSAHQLELVHLFVRAPSVFAMTLGHRLNGVGCIQLHDWVDGSYLQTAMLHAG